MSRTFRRKNAEQLVSNRGGKIAGVYTEVDRYERTGNGHGGYPVYREPTKVERFDTFYRLHGDKIGYHRFQGMKKWARRDIEGSHRARHRQLVSNFLQGKTDDVVHEKLPYFPCWYW